MRKNISCALLILTLCFALTGCVSVPPLINVQHREAGPDTYKKLDDIDRRLQRLEQRLDQLDKR